MYAGRPPVGVDPCFPTMLVNPSRQELEGKISVADSMEEFPVLHRQNFFIFKLIDQQHAIPLLFL